MLTNRNASPIWAPLAEIHISERALRGLSASTVEQYRGWLEQGREAPPIRIARVADGYVVRDGRHRVAAALAAGHRLIEAEVRPIARLCRWLGSIARLSGAALPGRPEPGDEVLPEEHLACTEEERVRLPPSPLFARSASADAHVDPDRANTLKRGCSAPPARGAYSCAPLMPP